MPHGTLEEASSGPACPRLPGGLAVPLRGIILWLLSPQAEAWLGLYKCEAMCRPRDLGVSLCWELELSSNVPLSLPKSIRAFSLGFSGPQMLCEPPALSGSARRSR